MPWHATHNRIEALRKRRVPADRPGPAQGLRSATIGITHCSAGSWCPTAPSIRPSHTRGGDQGRYFRRNKSGVPLVWKQLSRNTYRTKDERLGMAEGEFERLQGAGVV